MDRKVFDGETLGYVTPWNSRGYDFAKLFRSKFTYISPVWLQIREDLKDKTPIVTGTHDVDQQWIHDVRGGARTNNGAGPKIVPRVVYERNKLASVDVPVIISELLALSDRHAFDGFVFEIPVVEGTMDLLLRMGEAFRDANKLLLIVLNRSTKGVRSCSIRWVSARSHSFSLSIVSHWSRESCRSRTRCSRSCSRSCTGSR